MTRRIVANASRSDVPSAFRYCTVAAGELQGLDLPPRLVAPLGQDRDVARLAGFDGAAGQAPLPVVVAPLQQHPALLEDHRRHPGPDHHGARLYGATATSASRRAT